MPVQSRVRTMVRTQIGFESDVSGIAGSGMTLLGPDTYCNIHAVSQEPKC